MDLIELLEHFNKGETIGEEWAVIEQMRFYSREAQKITMEINTKYHEPGAGRTVLKADRKACRQRIRTLPAVLYGLRQEHNDREQCVHQCRLQIPGPGRDLHRRWRFDRA